MYCHKCLKFDVVLKKAARLWGFAIGMPVPMATRWLLVYIWWHDSIFIKERMNKPQKNSWKLRCTIQGYMLHNIVAFLCSWLVSMETGYPYFPSKWPPKQVSVTLYDKNLKEITYCHKCLTHVVIKTPQSVGFSDLLVAMATRRLFWIKIAITWCWIIMK